MQERLDAEIELRKQGLGRLCTWLHLKNRVEKSIQSSQGHWVHRFCSQRYKWSSKELKAHKWRYISLRFKDLEANYEIEDLGITQKVQHAEINAYQGFYNSRMFFLHKGQSAHAVFILHRAPEEISTLTTIRSYQSICFINTVDFSVVYLSFFYSPKVPQSHADQSTSRDIPK